MPSPATFVLTLSCPDAPGIVYDVSRFLMEQGGNVTQSQQFGDHEAGLFFMRVEFQSVSGDLTLAGLREDFVRVAASHSMEWQLSMSDEKQRVLILPSFKGAHPYLQAHRHGVKLVGATAHYVTADLDESPIIEQEMARVDHTMDPDELIALGRDNECRALARAVRWHSENRVLLNGRRTVVFR